MHKELLCKLKIIIQNKQTLYSKDLLYKVELNFANEVITL